jgi:hypothetical protein
MELAAYHYIEYLIKEWNCIYIYIYMFHISSLEIFEQTLLFSPKFMYKTYIEECYQIPSSNKK